MTRDTAVWSAVFAVAYMRRRDHHDAVTTRTPINEDAIANDCAQAGAFVADEAIAALERVRKVGT